MKDHLFYGDDRNKDKRRGAILHIFAVSVRIRLATRGAVGSVLIARNKDARNSRKTLIKSGKLGYHQEKYGKDSLSYIVWW